MKYFSEKLNRVFDTPEALADAENAEVNAVKSALKSDEVANESKTPTKKQLAVEVEKAEEALKKAYSDYELAKKNAEQVSKDYLTAIDAIMEPAKKAVKEAEKAKYDAINRFNAEFGPYQVVYTGSRAAEEMLKAINDINSRSRNFWDRFFWI